MARTSTVVESSPCCHGGASRLPRVHGVILPSARQGRWLLLLLFSAACGATDSGQAATPTAPGPAAERTFSEPTPTTVPRGGFTIRGVITEQTGSGAVRPLVGANVNAWVDTGRLGYSYMWANGARLSADGGRFELTGLPDSARVIVDAYKAGYVQQCAAPPQIVAADATVDIELIPRGLVSASPEAVRNRPGFRSISGVVYENTSGGRRPVAGVFVDYEPVMDSPAALTVTDANGRYLLCGIPQDEIATLGSSLGTSRVVYVEVPRGQTTADLVIP
jgi:hypothetical protein